MLPSQPSVVYLGVSAGSSTEGRSLVQPGARSTVRRSATSVVADSRPRDLCMIVIIYSQSLSICIVAGGAVRRLLPEGISAKVPHGLYLEPEVVRVNTPVNHVDLYRHVGIDWVKGLLGIWSLIIRILRSLVSWIKWVARVT